MTSPVRALRAAFLFLTRVPVGGFPYSAEEWRWAAAYFPVVGAVVSALVAAVFCACEPLGETGAAYLALGASLLVTGAFHEDGLADTADALGGSMDREKLFLILKDSRIGSFGATALVISVAGRAALLAHAGLARVWGIVFVGAVARATAVWLMVVLPYATPEKAKSREITRASAPQALVGSGCALAIGAALVATHLLDALEACSIVVVASAVGVITGVRYQVRAGGVTGDFLGATEQLCELAGFAALAWGAP
jgi:adenosylcobinamide-GDP ribazoletransferase